MRLVAVTPDRESLAVGFFTIAASPLLTVTPCLRVPFPFPFSFSFSFVPRSSLPPQLVQSRQAALQQVTGLLEQFEAQAAAPETAA